MTRNELNKYNANRSEYRYIRPEGESWSVYVYGQDKRYTKTLIHAVILRDQLIKDAHLYKVKS